MEQDTGQEDAVYLAGYAVNLAGFYALPPTNRQGTPARHYNQPQNRPIKAEIKPVQAFSFVQCSVLLFGLFRGPQGQNPAGLKMPAGRPTGGPKRLQAVCSPFACLQAVTVSHCMDAGRQGHRTPQAGPREDRTGRNDPPPLEGGRKCP